MKILAFEIKGLGGTRESVKWVSWPNNIIVSSGSFGRGRCAWLWLSFDSVSSEMLLVIMSSNIMSSILLVMAVVLLEATTVVQLSEADIRVVSGCYLLSKK